MISQKNNLTEKIRDFVILFFKSLKCKLNEKEGVYTISNVPNDFEMFVGKYSPYVLVFDMEKHKQIENSELMINGSYLLKAMRDYMQNKGQTSLLYLDLKAKEPQNEINKELKFGNCKIVKVIKKESISNLLRFIFYSSCEFLNNKKQLLNSIYVLGNRIVDISMDDYDFKEGNSKEFNLEGMEESYTVSKRKLKNILFDETKDIKIELKGKLSKELQNLKNHFKNQLKEKDEELEKTREKIKLHEGQLEHAYYGKDIKNLKRKIKECESKLLDLEKEGYIERMKKDEQFHLDDETDKHSLRIENNLVNISIINYPVYLFEVLLEKDELKKQLDLSFDPVLDRLVFPLCDRCKEETKEINLCSNLHIVCNGCLSKCNDCKKEFCLRCLEVECNDCSKGLCKDCKIICHDCKKEFCKKHIEKCKVCKNSLCEDCMQKCEECNKGICKKHFKECPSCKREICEDCSKKDFTKCEECNQILCTKCLVKCKYCEKILCNNHIFQCKDCKTYLCSEHKKKCSVCSKVFCSKCAKRCEGCNKSVCHKDTTQCKKCNSKVCNNCIKHKKALFGIMDLQRCINCIDK